MRLTKFIWLLLFIIYLACPEGSWGINCKNKCTCENGATCDTVTGECLCRDGWYGPHCREGKTDLDALPTGENIGGPMTSSKMFNCIGAAGYVCMKLRNIFPTLKKWWKMKIFVWHQLLYLCGWTCFVTRKSFKKKKKKKRNIGRRKTWISIYVFLFFL